MKRIYLFLLLVGFHFALLAQNVVLFEYFIDTDAGFNNNTVVNVTPAADGTFPFNVDLTNVSIGAHKLYIRTRDNDGEWSLTSRRNIEVVPSFTDKNVTAAEYFFDTDPGVGNATSFSISPQTPDITQNFVANTSSLTPGNHKLYIRTKDDQDKWSLTSRRNVEVISNNGPLYVSGVEYFFGDDPGVGKASYINFETPLSDGTFNFTIPASDIPSGADTLYMRVKDSTNKNWSLTASKIKYFITSSCPENVWLGAVSTDWHNPANWNCNQVPDASTDVIIVSNTSYSCEVLTGNTAVCHKITAVQGGNVRVNNGATLTVSGN